MSVCGTPSAPGPLYACPCPLSTCFAANPGGHVAESPDSHLDRQQDGRASLSLTLPFPPLSADLIRLGAPDYPSVKRGGGETPHEGVRHQRGEHPTPHLAIKPRSVAHGDVKNSEPLGPAWGWVRCRRCLQVAGPCCSQNPRGGTAWWAGGRRVCNWCRSGGLALGQTCLNSGLPVLLLGNTVYFSSIQ